ncbi:MAG: tRNA preQ1(34) S-adenosylmethionine ribosyltransferase-isomerase QueA [Elusimicrobia bacterium]|nr:tRNA preQ1(34) S-adenosylmethionine ribosyltransferase-isomerase QueA [Elusimicrobiota bacterium]
MGGARSGGSGPGLPRDPVLLLPRSLRGPRTVTGLPRTDFEFEFPEDLVADGPAAERDASRLLVLRRSGGLEHWVFKDLPDLLSPGDCVVLNRSKVLPARLAGRKATGGAAELLLIAELAPGLWSALATGLKPGVAVDFGGGVSGTAEERAGDGAWLVRFSTEDMRPFLETNGLPPLPPYIRSRRKRQGLADSVPGDLARYQTVYARERGSLAAPTAGLHYTPELLAKLRERGITVAEVILHVGLGTFRPVVAEDVSEHEMLPERYEVPEAAVAALRAAKTAGGRIVAVGTTATRTLETVFANGLAQPPAAPLSGEASLYILPGYEFKAVDALQTNFHQPASTPLLLTCAFAGKERVLAAYREAIAQRYRLFSYGDAMIIL